jgi:hypothetical protein
MLPVFAASGLGSKAVPRPLLGARERALVGSFLCGVYSNYSNDVCFTVTHITGEQWYAFNLTTWRERGCTPWQLRG